MTWQEWQEWVQRLIIQDAQDFGVSSFFSTPQRAATWVQDKVILPNPRLSDIERQILMDNSAHALDIASSQCVGNPTPDQLRECALTYWQLMQDYIVLNTNDQKLYELFETGVDAASSATVAGQLENIGKNGFKLPWWIWLLPIALLMRKR